MKCITVFNKAYLKIYSEIFLPTFPASGELTSYYIPENKHIPFKDIDGFKNKFIYRYFINNIWQDESFAFFDTDIIFLFDFFQEWQELLKEYDLIMQWDNPQNEINIGCMGIKNTKLVKELFYEYVFMDNKYVNDVFGFGQRYFNYLLKQKKYSNIKKYVLPFEYAGRQIEAHGYKYPDKLKLYHATFEPDVNSKLLILQKLYSQYYVC